VGATFFVTLRIVPLGPARTRVELRTHIAPMSAVESLLLGAGQAARELRRLAPRLPLPLPAIVRDRGGQGDGSDVLAEDLRAAEAVQRAMASPSFSVGPLATDFEAAITTFQRNILDHVGVGPTGGIGAPAGARAVDEVAP
jgi:hypothetical protein